MLRSADELTGERMAALARKARNTETGGAPSNSTKRIAGCTTRYAAEIGTTPTPRLAATASSHSSKLVHCVDGTGR